MTYNFLVKGSLTEILPSHQMQTLVRYFKRSNDYSFPKDPNVILGKQWRAKMVILCLSLHFEGFT